MGNRQSRKKTRATKDDILHRELEHGVRQNEKLRVLAFRASEKYGIPWNRAYGMALQAYKRVATQEGVHEPV